MDSNDIINFNKISNLINENDVLVDVGANFGDYINFFLTKIKHSGLIYGIELEPTTYNTLVTKFGQNSNVLLFNNAASDNNDLIDYYAGLGAHTNNIIGHDMEYRPNNKIGQIKAIRLDDLLNNEKTIKLIKIDVEGAEALVLKGLSKIIENVQYILVECHLDNDWPEIKDLLLNTYNLNCSNNITDEVITQESKRPYQCLCKKK